MKRFVLSLALTAAALLLLLTACGGEKPQKQVDLSGFAQTLQENHEFAAYLTALDPDAEEYAIEQYLPGLLEMDLEQRVILMTLISINNGEIDLVQAKNAEDAARVKDIFQARIDYMAGDGETPGGAWYPGPTELWKNSSQVVVNGNYVMLVCGDGYEQIVDEFNALFD